MKYLLVVGMLGLAVFGFGLSSALAQFKTPVSSVGIRIGAIRGNTSLDNDRVGYQGRAIFRRLLGQRLYGELGAGYGEIQGDLYRTQLVPVDLRLLFRPASSERWSPYMYLGVGSVYRSLKRIPPKSTPGVETSGWTGYLPVGIGAQILLDDIAALDISGGYNYTFTDALEGLQTGKNDGFWGLTFGVNIMGDKGDDDPDHDGLTNSAEKRLRTDPLNPDTDGDRLSDGDEYLKYKTNPLNPDTDGDGLTDGAEVLTYNTDPLNPDTDGDGLTDGSEVLNYKTNPLRVDTDGDGLSDGDEVLRYHTNPLEIDTDGGSIADGVEVRRGTDPLNPVDDVPKPRRETLKIEVGKAIVLEGITFEFGSARIRPESEDILEKAFNTLEDNPEIEVEILGHTDNIGKPSYNLRLSQGRAESVKDYLVGKGIDPSRIVTRGFGSIRPIATNETDEGRQRNRRIEFVRVK